MSRAPLLVALLVALPVVVGCQAAAPAEDGWTPRPDALAATSAPAAPGPATAAAATGMSPVPAEPITGVFHSVRYRYAWVLPAGWTVTETPGTGGVHPGEPGLDTFSDGRGATITVGVTAVAATQALGSWVCPVVAHLEGFHGEAREAVASIAVGGGPATISTFHFVAPPYRVLELEVQAIRGTQGFFVSWTDTLTPTVPDAVQLARFEALLTGFSFDPAA